MTFDIADIRIIPVRPINGLVAFASCTLGGTLYISSIAIHRKLDDSGYRLTYPTKKSGNKDFTLFHPLEPKLSKALEEAIFAEYRRLHS
ncbi:MAG: septation protein SpoVG family protein [Rhabdochlamydiaceae bacterium]|nr:septation protein SpoVG family protein [Rhabdochlamydiaceae bacterium]MBP9773110.1 septation protein SpoVG family protein [Candidatus Peribacteraceae bacterium]